MRRIVVISTNESPEYYFNIPIVTWAWNKLGWDVMILAHHLLGSRYSPVTTVEERQNILIHINPVEGYRSATFFQVGRLFAASFVNIFMKMDDYLMTSDADMLPLSDYWQCENPNRVRTWGRDLTNYHYPICYIGTRAHTWINLMGIFGSIGSEVKDCLAKYPKAKSLVWEEWWQVDQDIITEKINKKISDGWYVDKIDRGIATNSHLPKGRVDRYNWDLTLGQTERIDAHLPRPAWKEENFSKIMDLLKECFNISGFDQKWMWEYRDHFVSQL